jgi:hypothetical protein
MTSNTVKTAFFVLAIFLSGCTAVMPEIVVTDSSKWSRGRAIEIINGAETGKSLVYPDKFYNEYEDVGFWQTKLQLKPIGHLADEEGLTAVKLINGATPEQGAAGEVEFYHVPYSEVSSVKLVKRTAPLFLAFGLFTPLYDMYQVDVRIKNRTLNYRPRDYNEIWIWVPFWCLRPLYFVNNTKTVQYAKSRDLAEALEYLRQNASTQNVGQ